MPNRSDGPAESAIEAPVSGGAARLVAGAMVALLFALAFAGCSPGGDSGDTSTDPGSSGSGETAAGTETEGVRSTGAPEVPQECAEFEQSRAEAEAVTEEVEQRGTPDVSAMIEATRSGPSDEVEGTGVELIEDGAVVQHLLVARVSDGEVLESTWEGGPGELTLDGVSESFIENLSGMAVGARRAFRIGAGELAGGEPPDEELAADDELLVVVDLIDVFDNPNDPEILEMIEERGAPLMEVPEGDDDPDELVVVDQIAGEGEVVCPGARVVVHYRAEGTDGFPLSASWDFNEVASFDLGTTAPPGWEEGLVGMRAGGRRTLVVPEGTTSGDGDTIAPLDRPAIFVVDLVGVS